MTTAWVGGVQAQETPNFGGQVTVSTETTWIFDNEGDGETTGINQTSHNNGLWNRSKTSGGGFTFTAPDEGATKTLIFGDGYGVTVSKIACSSDFNKTNMSTHYAGDNENEARPFFAVNASVPGTCYAYVKAGSKNNSVKKMRIQFYGKDETPETKNQDGSSSEVKLEEIVLTSTQKGVFFIGGTASADASTPNKIYAIRFVPTESASKYVYIGATGYMTFSDANKHYSTPTGLSAYGAKAADGGNAVELIAATNIKKQNGYILKGTPNTNYKLTELATGPTEPKGNELKRQASAKTFSVDGDGKDSENKYNYILAADNGVAKFFAVENGTTLAVGKAWLQTTTQLTPAAGSRGVSIIFADEATGIEAVTTQQGDGQWYNLQGQKVAQPAKGLFIKNGKKVIIK